MIRLYNVVLKDSLLGNPFAPNSKYVISAGAAIAAAAIAAAGTVAAGAMSAGASNAANNANSDMNKANIDMQKETNQLNATLQRETNAQNYKIFQESNAFNLDMWNKANAYNSPQAQVQRLLAAGINPSSQFGNVSQASQLTSASAPSMNAPTMQAPKNEFMMRPTDFSGISDSGIAAVNAYNASRMMQAETRNKEALTANTAVDTTYRNKSMADSLRMLKNMADGHGWQADFAKRQLEFFEATMNYDIQMKYGDTVMQKKSFEMLEKQIRTQELQADILEITKGYADKMNQAQIAQLWSAVHQANAQVGLIEANTMLTNEERLNRIEQRTGLIVDNELKGFERDIKKAVKSSIIQSYKNEANLGMYNAFDAWLYNPRGERRDIRDQIGIDFLPDKLSRLAKRYGYVPKF